MAVSPVTMAILRLYKQPSDVLEVKPYRLKKEDKPCKVNGGRWIINRNQNLLS